MGKIIKFIIIAFVALAILGAAAFWGLAGFFAPKDMEESLIPDAASQFFDINGRVISTTASEERRLPVAFDKIPKHLQQAFIAIEDNRFYEHGGIDFRGTARALWTNLRGGEVQGGSTITQQLLKNNVFTNWTQESSWLERFTRKIQEQYLAIEVEKKINDKNVILENYLNTINLGAGAYGVQAAAKGAGIGAGIYKDHNEAFASLKKLAVIDPDEANRSAYLEAYSAWKEEMKKL